MDREIKRLLKLSNIPNFKLTEAEQVTLDKWKKAQVPVKPKRKYTRKKNTNNVKLEEKTTGEIEMAPITTNYYLKNLES